MLIIIYSKEYNYFNQASALRKEILYYSSIAFLSDK